MNGDDLNASSNIELQDYLFAQNSEDQGNTKTDDDDQDKKKKYKQSQSLNEIQQTLGNTDDKLMVDLNAQKYSNFDNIKQRKVDRQIFMKKWEDNRIQLCSFFQRIVERLNQKLLEKGMASTKNFEQIIKFFRIRVQADLKYSQTRIQIIKNLYTSKNGAVLDYQNLNEGLRDIQEQLSIFQAKVQQVAKRIENEIIEELLQPLQKTCMTKHAEYQQSSQELKKVYSDAFDISLAKYRIYSLIFNQTMKNYQKKPADQDKMKDLTICELEYLEDVDTHYTTLKQLGRESLRFYYEMIEREKQKIATIKKAFEIYENIMSEIIIFRDFEEENSSIRSIAALFENIETVDEFETFQVTELLEYQESHFLKKIYNTEEVDFNQYQSFVEEFKLKQIQERPLLVKEIKGLLQVVKQNNVDWTTCALQMTVDKTILIIQGDDSFFKVPTFQIAMFPSCVEVNHTTQELIIYASRKSFFCCGQRKQYIIKVINAQDLTEFSNLAQQAF